MHISTRWLRGPALAVAGVLLLGSAAFASQMALSPKDNGSADPTAGASASETFEPMETPEPMESAEPSSSEDPSSDDAQKLMDMLSSPHPEGDEDHAGASPSASNHEEMEDESGDDSHDASEGDDEGEHAWASPSDSASASPSSYDEESGDHGTDD